MPGASGEILLYIEASKRVDSSDIKEVKEMRIVPADPHSFRHLHVIPSPVFLGQQRLPEMQRARS